MSALNIQQLQFKYSSSAEFKLTIDHLSMNKGDHLFIDGPSGNWENNIVKSNHWFINTNKWANRYFRTNIHRLSAIKRDAFRRGSFWYQSFNYSIYSPI